MTMLERVARALCRRTNLICGAKEGEDEWRSYLPEARDAVEAMRDPTPFVTAAIEHMAEKRYRAAPEMQRWYGDDVWNAGIDAALAERVPAA